MSGARAECRDELGELELKGSVDFLPGRGQTSACALAAQHSGQIPFPTARA